MQNENNSTKYHDKEPVHQQNHNLEHGYVFNYVVHKIFNRFRCNHRKIELNTLENESTEPNPDVTLYEYHY